MIKSVITKKIGQGLKAVQKTAPPPPDDLLYPYLQKAYLLRTTLERDYSAQQIGPAFDELAAGLHPKTLNRADVTRAIIELTVGSHVTTKMKGKYADALNWALVKGINSKRLRRFIKLHGGLNGCVAKYSQYRKSGRTKGNAAEKATRRRR